MDTGDPTNLFSNLLVFYAMYLLSYNQYSKELKKSFLKITRGIVFVVCLICFAGWIDIITITEVEGQFYIAISETMKLGENTLTIMNVHVFFLLLSIKLAILSGYESIWGIEDRNRDNNANENVGTKKKGA
jgi:hypothetical protein